MEYWEWTLAWTMVRICFSIALVFFLSDKLMNSNHKCSEKQMRTVKTLEDLLERNSAGHEWIAYMDYEITHVDASSQRPELSPDACAVLLPEIWIFCFKAEFFCRIFCSKAEFFLQFFCQLQDTVHP